MNEYNKVKEIVNEDVYIVTYTKKERKCDICSCIKLSKDITIIKYPILNKHMGRMMMTKKVCSDCYSDVKEVLDNLKYN